MMWEEKAGLYPQRMRWYNPTLGRWITIDPSLFTANDANFYRAMRNNPCNFLDWNALKVHVFWAEGFNPDGRDAGKHLEHGIVKKLQEAYDKKDVVFHQYSVQLGDKALDKIAKGESIQEDICKIVQKDDKIVLIGYSWGGYTMIHALTASQFKSLNNPNPQTRTNPSYKADLVYLIDPVINLNIKNPKPFSNSKTNDDKKLPSIFGNFTKGVVWYQQVDTGIARFLNVKIAIHGSKIEDPRLSNIELGKDKFTDLSQAHVDMAYREDIYITIKGGIDDLLK